MDHGLPIVEGGQHPCGAADRSHRVGERGVEIDRISWIQYGFLFADDDLESSLQHVMKFLPCMAAVLDHPGGPVLDFHDEGLHVASGVVGRKALVFQVPGTLNPYPVVGGGDNGFFFTQLLAVDKCTDIRVQSRCKPEKV